MSKIEPGLEARYHVARLHDTAGKHDDYLESHRTTESTRLLREVRDELVRVLDGGA